MEDGLEHRPIPRHNEGWRTYNFREASESMGRDRAMRLARMLTAAFALAGSIGSLPVLGHSHGPPDGTSLRDHVHSPRQPEQDGHLDHVVTSRIGAYSFHLHGTWFGMPFSLASPPITGQVDRAGHVLASDLSPMQPVTIVVTRIGWDLSFGPLALWFLCSLCAPSERALPLTSRLSEAASITVADLLWSVRLRC